MYLKIRVRFRNTAVIYICFLETQTNAYVKHAKMCLMLITYAFSPQGVTFDHASIFDALGAL